MTIVVIWRYINKTETELNNICSMIQTLLQTVNNFFECDQLSQIKLFLQPIPRRGTSVPRFKH